MFYDIWFPHQNPKKAEFKLQRGGGAKISKHMTRKKKNEITKNWLLYFLLLFYFL
jgi:hypothetical protein